MFEKKYLLRRLFLFMNLYLPIAQPEGAEVPSLERKKDNLSDSSNHFCVAMI